MKHISQKFKGEPVAPVPTQRVRIADAGFQNASSLDVGSESTMTEEESQAFKDPVAIERGNKSAKVASARYAEEQEAFEQSVFHMMT